MAFERTHDVLGVRVDDLTSQDTRERLRGWLRNGSARMVFTPNPEIVLRARHDPDFRALLNRADLSVPDGVGLAYAVAALSGERLEHRHTGVDLLEELAALCAKEGKRLLLFGGRHGSAQAAADALRARYAALDVRAHEAGAVELHADAVDAPRGDLEAIRLFKPDALAVALGQEKQERFIGRYLPTFPSVRVAVGVGGSFEMISGRLPRAPKLLRSLGLEWTWRLALEPRRAVRIFRAVIVFPATVVWDTLKRRRFLNACWNVIQALGFRH